MIGAVLGFVALILAAFFGFWAIASAFNVSVNDIFLPAIGTLLGLYLLAYLVVKVIVERQKAGR